MHPNRNRNSNENNNNNDSINDFDDNWFKIIEKKTDDPNNISNDFVKDEFWASNEQDNNEMIKILSSTFELNLDLVCRFIYSHVKPDFIGRI